MSESGQELKSTMFAPLRIAGIVRLSCFNSSPVHVSGVILRTGAIQNGRYHDFKKILDNYGRRGASTSRDRSGAHPRSGAEQCGGGNDRLPPALRQGRPACLRQVRHSDRTEPAAPCGLAADPRRLVVVGKVRKTFKLRSRTNTILDGPAYLRAVLVWVRLRLSTAPQN
jgi:hypothetical protein